MIRTELIQKLRNYGIGRTTITDLFLYYLTTEDRQAHLLEWMKENSEACDQDSILKEAQNILSTYLSKNPYNTVAKDAPLPKWMPPKEEKPQTPTKPIPTISIPTPIFEDPFDRVLQSFFKNAGNTHIDKDF